MNWKRTKEKFKNKIFNVRTLINQILKKSDIENHKVDVHYYFGLISPIHIYPMYFGTH